jgi:teichuronic acid biosynthesis glycosyltransferase TuaC
MNITIVTQIFPTREQPYRGHSVFQTALRLKQWSNVRVIAPHARYTRWVRLKTRSWSKTDLSYTPPGSLVTQYCDYPAFPLVSRAANGWQCAKSVAPFVAKDRPDVILSYWVYPDGFAAVNLGRRFGIPVVIKAIGSDVNNPGGPVQSALARYALRHADMCMTVSEDLRRKVIAMGISDERVCAVANGCDTSVFRVGDRKLARKELGLAPIGSLVLYVGRLDLAKGLRELLLAVAKIVSARPLLRVALVGEGPARAELKELAKRLRINEHVIWGDPCSSSDIARWMAGSDVCVLPSYREGCPNVVLEALSCGRPVVGTFVGGIPDLVNEDCGILVPPQNVNALTEAISICLGREWDAEEISRQQRRSWEQVAAETFEICSALVANKTKAAEPIELRTACK